MGMVSFSDHIELELCPTCLRNTNQATYRQDIFNRITSARYHGGWTSTGETVKCLADHILPSPRCRVLEKPTQVIFFTDGQHNGCLNTTEQMKALVNKYPTLEIYAIGMGPDIKSSGVAELQGSNDPFSIFNVKDVEELERLMNVILGLVFTGKLVCAPLVG